MLHCLNTSLIVLRLMVALRRYFALLPVSLALVYGGASPPEGWHNPLYVYMCMHFGLLDVSCAWKHVVMLCLCGEMVGFGGICEGNEIVPVRLRVFRMALFGSETGVIVTRDRELYSVVSPLSCCCCCAVVNFNAAAERWTGG